MDIKKSLRQARNKYYGVQDKPQIEKKLRTDQERISILRNYIVKQVARGGKVEIQENFSAVLVWGKKPNHILHLILSLITVGFWLIVWLLLSMSMRVSRTLYTIDEYGFITESSQS